MYKNNLLLPKLMQHLKPLTSALGTDYQIWAHIFASHTSEEALHSGSVSRFITGKRPISHPYIKHYATVDTPQEPPELLTDLMCAMEIIADVPSSTQKMIDVLIEFIGTYIDPIDQPGLMPARQLRFPFKKDAAKLWTKVLWYAMCHDYTIA